MKFKYILIVSLILFILTIGAVSASDDCESGDNLTVSEITHEDNLKSGVSEEIHSTQVDESLEDFEVDDFDASVEEEVSLDSETEVVKLYCPENVGGSFIVYVGDNNYSYSIGENDFDEFIGWTLNDLGIGSAGEYTISLKYIPSEGEELTLIDEATLNVVEDEEKYTSDDFSFDTHDEISINDNGFVIYFYEFLCDGELNVYVDSQMKYSSTVYENNYRVISLSDLEISDTGTYNISIKFVYDGGEVDFDNFTLNVTDKLSSSNFNVTVRDNLIINSKVAAVIVECPENIEGNITININTQSLSKKINSTKIYFYPNELGMNTAQNYNIYVYYDNEDRILLNSGSCNVFESGREYDYFISLDIPQTVQIGNWASTRISITKKEFISGNITLYIDNELTSTVYLGDESFPSLEIGDLTFAKHSYNITYSGDDEHDAFTITGSFDVTYELEISFIENPYYAQTTSIYVNSYDNLDGDYVNLTVNGKTIKVEKGHFVEVKLDNLFFGENILNLSYAGDSKYSARSVTQIINVTPVIKFLNDDVLWNSSFESIILILPEDALGELVLYENDNVIANSSLVNGRAAISISNLTLGTFYFKACYEHGNYDVESVWNDLSIVPNIDVASDISSAEKNNITIKMPENYNGDLSVSIAECIYDEYSEEYYYSDESEFSDEIRIVDGRATLTIPELYINGLYSIKFEYVDDDEEYGYSINKFVTFHNDTSDLKLNIELDTEFVLGTDNAIVYLNLPAFHDGTVNVSINSTPYELILSETEMDVYNYCLNLENLTIGSYEATFNFNNDSYYKNASQKLTFKILPIKFAFDESIEIEGNDNVYVALGNNVDGRLIIKLDGNETFNRFINNKYFSDYYESSAWAGFIKLSDLNLGIHNLELIFDWNGQKFNKSGLINVTYLLDIDVDEDWDLRYGDDVTAEISIISDATSNVTIKAAGKTYSINPSDSNKIILSNLSFGNNTIYVTYNGDDKYPSRTVNKTVFIGPKFNISRYYEYNKDINMSISMAEDATGTFVIIIDDNEDYDYETEVVGGKASVLLPDLDMGLHWINAYYTGEDWGELFYEYTYFYIVPEVIIPELSDSGEYIITLNVPEDYEEDFEISFQNKQYSGSFIDGQAQITLTNLTEGVETLGLTVYSKYGATEYDYEIWGVAVRTSPDDYDLYVKVDKFIIYNSTEDITIYLPTGATGNVTVKIDNKIYDVLKIDDDYCVRVDLPLGVDELGLHIIEFIYSGDDYYTGSDRTFTYNVTYIEFPETVHAGYFEGENQNIYTIYASDVLEGVIRVFIDGIEVLKDFVYPYTDIKLNNITPGIHNYEIRYSGDGKISPFTQKGTFNATFDLYINADDVSWGSDVIISVDLPLDATGDITITVDGVNHTKTLIDGQVNFTIPDLDMGNYRIIAYYNGDSKYSAQFKNTTFDVEYAFKTNIDKNNLTIILMLPEDVNGTVYLSIEDYDYEVNITDGKAVFNTLLAPGDYIISAECDVENYEIEDLRQYLEITSQDFMSVEYLKEMYIGPQTINITLFNKGNLTIYFEDPISEDKIADIANYTNVNGKISVPFVLSNLAMQYIRIIYENDNYTVSDYYGIYANPILNIPREIQYGEEKNITIEIPNDEEYEVYVYIEEMKDQYSKEFAPQFKNHKAELTIPTLNPGTYSIGILCIGESGDEYNEFFTLFVNKDTPEFNVKNSTGGLVIEFKTQSTGKVLITVDGNDFLGAIENGEVVINDASLVNVKTVNMMYSGDKMYASLDVKAEVNASYDEELINPDLTVSVKNITYNQNANITVTINSDVVSGVVVNINNENHTVTLTHGKGSVIISNLNVGTYEVKAIFNGNSKYNPIEKNTTLKVSKAGNPITVTVGEEYLIGSAFDIVVSNSTRVNVTVGDISYNIVDDKVVIDTTTLSEGEYTIIVNASESENYLANSTSKTFKISKYNSDLSVDVKNISLGESAIVNISINENITGMLVYSFNEYNATVKHVKGKGNITFSNLSAGDYTVKVAFLGDEKFAFSEKTVSFTVTAPKPTYEPRIAANDLTTLYTAGALYTVQVYGSDGNVAGGVLVQFKINGKVVASKQTDNEGYASFKISQSVGVYTIVSQALTASATKKLTVSGILTLKSVSVKKSAKKLTLQASLKKVNGKYIKNKKITFKFNGKKYTAKTNSKGVAKLTIKKTVLKKLKVGKKINYQAIYLKESKIKVVKVKK